MIDKMAEATILAFNDDEGQNENFNRGRIDDAFSYHLHGGMGDDDYGYLLWAMECDGIPAELLEPIREYFRQPVPTEEKLLAWLNGK